MNKVWKELKLLVLEETIVIEFFLSVPYDIVKKTLVGNISRSFI